MNLRSGKLPFLGSEDEFFYHTGADGYGTVFRLGVVRPCATCRP
jgi:hypothetical protein